MRLSRLFLFFFFHHLSLPHLTLPHFSPRTHFSVLGVDPPIRSLLPSATVLRRVSPTLPLSDPLALPSHRADAPPPHRPRLSALPPVTPLQRGESSTHQPSHGSSSAAPCFVCLHIGARLWAPQTVIVPTSRHLHVHFHTQIHHMFASHFIIRAGGDEPRVAADGAATQRNATQRNATAHRCKPPIAKSVLKCES